MATIPTNQPTPSEDPRDLKFNAGKLDEVVSSSAHFYTDRFGVQRWTIAGINYTAAQAIAQFGYITVDSFQAGATLTLPNQALRDTSTGEYYRWDGAFPKTVVSGSTPASTGGVSIGAWISVGDGALRSNLISSTDGQGDALVAVKQPGNSVGRTVHQKMLEAVSIADYIKPDGNVANAIVNAINSTHGNITIPAGSFIANPDISQVPTILKLLSRGDFEGRLLINLPAGTVNLTEETQIKGNRQDLCSLVGVAHNLTVTGFVGVVGGAKSYQVTLSVSDVSNASVGDYLMIRHDITGTGFFHIHCGGWKILSISGNNVTVLNTSHTQSFPTQTVTSASAVIVKTVLQYTGCDGMRPEGGGCIGIINNLALVGDYDISTGTGTIGAHGVIAATPVVVTDGGASTSNNVANMDGAISLGSSVVISAWGEQGLAISGRTSAVCNFIASCSNRKRGVYAEGAAIRGKFMLCSGNGEDGIISDTSGFVQAAYAVCSGNGLNGFWSTNLSFIAAARSVACGNLTNGYEARGATRLGADLGLAYGNALNGVSASDGGNVDFDGGVTRGNAFDGLFATYGSIIDANDVTSTANVRYGANVTDATINASGSGSLSGNGSVDVRDNGNGVVVRPNGVIYPFTGIPQKNVSIRNETSEAGGDIASTTIGDMVISLKSTSGGTLNVLYILKADGTLHPQNDATQNCGRAANRWNIGFFAGGTQSTSDAELKDPIRDFTQAELNAAMRMAKILGFWTWLDDAAKRLHAGTTVQAALKIMEEEGLDWTQYGFIGLDQWDDEYEPVMIDDGYGHMVESGEVKLVREAGKLWQFRDQEFDRFIMRGLAERISKIEESLQ